MPGRGPVAALLPRLAFAALSVLATASLAFLLVRLAPGGGGAALAVAGGGEHGAAGLAEELARAQGLDRPILAQWLSWLGGLPRGDLGWSWRAGAPVASLIAERLPVTLALMLPAVLLGAATGLGLGLAASALRPGGVAARGGAAALNALHALPVFVLAQLLVLALALRAGLLPVQGLEDPRAPPPPGDAPALAASWARHLALPVLSLALHQLCLMALLARAGVAAELARPYALAARARGNGGWRLRRRHALPNAAPPLVALLGVRLGGGLIGGAVVIETVFALPGLGRLAVSAAVARDHAVVVGVVLVASAATVLANLLTDAALAWRDPLRRAGPAAR